MTFKHRATRTVRLPESWPNAPRDVQVNYYNYLAKRLIYSTDVYIGDRLVYRTNAVACRGDDLQPGQPVVLILGDDFIHGDLSGSLVDQVEIGPCRILNGAIEGLPFTHAVERFNELVATVSPVAAVLAPPRRWLIPEVNRVTKAYEGDWETDWEGQMERIQRPPIFAILPKPPNNAADESEDDPPILERFDRFLTAWTQKRGVPLLTPEEGAFAGFRRRLGLAARPRRDQHPVAGLIEQRLKKPILAHLKAHPGIPKAAPPSAEPVHGAHGPEDVGRNYPLW